MNSIVNSIRKNKTGIMIMLLSAVTSSFGQYFWKLSHNYSDLRTEIILVAIGFIFYGVGAVCMIVAFRHGSFSVLHPMQSMSYIFALLIGYFFLNEIITLFKLTGLLFILFGAFMIGVGDE